jgi:hypothetical protein
MFFYYDKWVPVTTTWHILGLWMKEQPPIYRVVANILNKQSWAAHNVWSSSLGVEQDASNSTP